MAAQTQGAIDAVLGALATAIQEDLRLIGSVHSDMKFIKDEMDSMNGFLMHLNKMESEKHDDRVRAWMKQVREVSYVSEDCVDRYRRVLTRYGGVGCWGGGGGGGFACAGTLLFILAHPMAYLELRNLGTQIAELKARVRDVGERRERYDVSVPVDTGGDHKMEHRQNKLPEEEEEKRKLFVHDELEEKDVVGTPGWFRSRAKHHAPVGQLIPAGHPSDEATKMMMGAILEKCRPREAEAEAELDVDPREAAAFRCTRKMFLCAMYMYPSNPTSSTQELSKLKEKVVKGVVGAQEARKQVMIFCYSILTTQQKSCLQYLTAFLHETKISRTSMVRRWVAEGLVGSKDDVPGGGGGRTTTTTPEEAGERCFSELLLRGFIRANGWSDAGTVKSCVMDEPVRDFIEGITKSENFVVELPAHLDRQLKIRSIVRRRASTMAPPPPLPVLVRRCCNLRWCGGRGCTWLLDDHRASSGDDATAKDPMDELVEFIKALPEQYRLNVLDLGGCTGLNKSRHLKSFAEVECLKYLSLRKTDVRRLHARLHINKLTLLETLDIRDTYIPPRDTVSIYLPKLKHLLAGSFLKTTVVGKASLVTVRMPDRIGSMRDMETLSHVQVSMDGAELQRVAKLHQLRKLGVVVHANNTTAALLGRVLYMLAANLRSLSIWVKAGGGGTGGGILDVSSMYEMASSLVLENLDIKGKMSLPLWIGRASKLANVTLRDTEMDGGDALRRLATVQSLRCLKLSGKAFTEQALRFKDVQFQALKFLVVEGDAVTRIVFLAMDAAPKLQKIVWAIGGGSKIEEKYNEDLITGIHLLPDLKVIELRATFNLANLLEWTKPQTTSANPSAASSAENPSAGSTETPSPSAETPSAASSAENPSAASAKNPTYRIRYISSSDGQLITELPSCTDEKLSLPAGIINYNKQ